MPRLFLLPYRARYYGWLLFIPAAVLGIYILSVDQFHFDFLTVSIPSRFVDDILPITKRAEYTPINLTDEIAALGVILGLLLIAFSRERIEDEMISRMRLEALQWSVVINYVILAILILTVHGLDFLYVLDYNMFTLLLVFVVRMRWLMYRHNHHMLAL